MVPLLLNNKAPAALFVATGTVVTLRVAAPDALPA